MDKNGAAVYAHTGMGTEMMHKAFGRHAAEALRAVAGEAKRLERMLSRFLPGSEIGKVNKSAGVKRENLSPATYEVLSRAAAIAKISHGLFDVTSGPLVDLWDYKHVFLIPDEARIKRVLPLVDHAGLVLDPRSKTAGLQRAGQSIDLGGIGKGFAADRFLETFKEYGVTSAFTNIGGNVSTLGVRPDGSPWRVGLRHPRRNGRLLGAVSVAGKAVVTSGDYERYFIDAEGKRRHHILDPTTGYPAESGLVSVTVVAGSATTADGLSTLLFIAGMEKGRKYLHQFPGAEAIFVDTSLTVYISSGLKDTFQAETGIETSVNYFRAKE
jgi:thiamine biosynthesis lipoprotein